jgi:tRNA G18 (ribose-2'-O)-methylase SpoU
MRQLGHYETLRRMPKATVDCVLYACGISCENLGLILRSADIFGVGAVYYQRVRRMLLSNLSGALRCVNILIL